MKTTNHLKIALWVNASVAEVGAVAALFSPASWSVVNELTGGYRLLFGLEMALLAGLATWAASRREISRSLLGSVMSLNLLMLAFFLFVFETDPALSPLAGELLLIDAVIMATCLVIEWRGSKAPVNVPVSV